MKADELSERLLALADYARDRRLVCKKVYDSRRLPPSDGPEETALATWMLAEVQALAALAELQQAVAATRAAGRAAGKAITVVN